MNDGNATAVVAMTAPRIPACEFPTKVARFTIDFDAMKQYLPFYPDRIYKNMFEVGLLISIPSHQLWYDSLTDIN